MAAITSVCGVLLLVALAGTQESLTVPSTMAICNTTSSERVVYECSHDCIAQYQSDMSWCGSDADCKQREARKLLLCVCDCKIPLQSEGCPADTNGTVPVVSTSTTSSVVSTSTTGSVVSISTTGSVVSTNKVGSVTAPSIAGNDTRIECLDEFQRSYNTCIQMYDCNRKCACFTKNLDNICRCSMALPTVPTDAPTAPTTPKSTTTPSPAPPDNTRLQAFIDCNNGCTVRPLDPNDRTSVLRLTGCNCRCLSLLPEVNAGSGQRSLTIPATSADALDCYKKYNGTFRTCSKQCDGSLYCEWRCSKELSEGACGCGATEAAAQSLTVVLALGLAVWAASD